MKKLVVLLVVVLASCSLFGPDFYGAWSGSDGGWPVTYTFTASTIKYEEGTAPAMRGPMTYTDTTLSFRFTEYYNGAWYDITPDMPWHSDTDTVWSWSVEGDTLFLIRDSDTLILVR